MKCVPLEIDRACIIETDVYRDSRGSFARLYCRDTFQILGLDDELAQTNLSSNPTRGTIRGLHYQLPPHEEVKVVTCVSGALFDVVADVRPESPTRGRWTAVTLVAGDGRSVYIPKGCAHGFQTLEGDTQVLYHISVPYEPSNLAGVRWNDPTLAISWPLQPAEISLRDQSLPLLSKFF